MIARLDTPRGGKPRFSDIARIWKEQFPDRIPRNEEQLKDKAWNIKATALMNEQPLPPKFDMIGMRKAVIQDLIDRGINPYRMERDLDENGIPTNVRL